MTYVADKVELDKKKKEKTVGKLFHREGDSEIKQIRCKTRNKSLNEETAEVTQVSLIKRTEDIKKDPQRIRKQKI